ncbi:MAG: hypothetical protein LQ352_003557 [Teloschistes flavicans]|nr:MAG: hypothetical protein LQ352_003557 [Teloschistes flavicans]
MSHPFLQSYTHLTTHLVPGPQSLSYFLPLLLLPLALCIPPTLLSKRATASLFLPLIGACLLDAWRRMGGVDVISVNVAQWSFVLLLCYDDPRSTFRRLRLRQKYSTCRSTDGSGGKEAGEVGYWEEACPSSLSKRIPWVLTLLISLRLSNWKIGVPSHDRTQPLQPMTRIAFTRYAVILVVQSFLVLDAAAFLTRQDPYFHTPSTTPIDSPWPLPSLHPSNTLTTSLALLPPRLIRAGILSAQAYALIMQGGSLPCIPVVLLSGLGYWPDEWSPHTWPPFFGPFAAVYRGGLRGLWGGWWHQTNRYLSVPGRWLAEKLEGTAVGRRTGCRKGGMGTYALMVLSGFGGSGVMHMGLIPPEPLDTGMGAGEMRLWIGGFFWVQILGIGFETVVEKLVPRRWWNGALADACRFLWVGGWLMFTVPMLAMPFRELGYWKYGPLPVSLIGYLGGRGWWAWG